ncbi:EAL domain-containing protein (putative c-di-GMP-specific phosphodiesterase class I)/GGDEF domain-containing protein [Herbaspirillum sp. Sphag1AN]|uniref:bifunctional diguanylate cyclase/phosphodiesterase n=1 Tax=unclassified Herbaspirillum TaxID=2624150 RepID=UPI0016199B41|nr:MULTISPECIES: EAL domain-containing protein [unclassified Herbaspirillum]MBB3213199.1 EAL domain-containing protein (putative c-di-GMP-specific phosphodiesterase class I)/GGDEF domain-containing protein [Herbaspirillum sp. Sphag1AN]MBB3246396.1 EAL domain-containing protein (putative c-di-GMP-specific phosphodiesterase class I)/GGDEF domain-containing protein [Herbaspirillum sp. Sphag64]
MNMRLLRKDHQWKVAHLLFGALIAFIGVLVVFGGIGFFWLEQDFEQKVVQPLLEREVNRVLDGFKAEYLAGGIFIRQIQGLLSESPVELSGDLTNLSRFLEALAKRENDDDPRFSYIQFGNKQGEVVALNLKGEGNLDFYVLDSLHRGGLYHYDRRPDVPGAKLLATTKGYDPRKRPWYINATAECPMVSPVYFSMGADAQWNASITCPLDRSSREGGVLAVDVSTKRLQKILDAAIRQSLIYGVFILDAEDNVLLKSERLNDSDKTFFIGAENSKAKFNPLVLSNLATPNAEFIDIHVRSHEQFLLYQQSLAGLGTDNDSFSKFRVVVISSRSEIFAVLNHLFWLSVFALILISLGALALIRLYRASITFPLMRLRDQAEKVASDEVVSAQEFSRLYLKGGAIEEIVSVQDAVKKMANSLFSLYQELRDVVDKDEESGQLSLIGATNLLQKMEWSTATVAVIEINNYVQLSDTLNRVAIRHLWRSLCERLLSCCAHLHEEHVYCYRHSDSRLVILMFGPQEEHQGALNKLRRESSPVLTTGAEEQVRVFLSIGVSYCSQSGETALEDTVSNAVLAVRSAQLANNGGYAVFELSMLEKEARIQALLNAMDSAVIEQEFSMHYQPICDLQTGAVYGVEALMRWNSPTLGMVPPSEFIPLAERSERIAIFGALALRHVARDIAQLAKEANLPEGFSAHVNVSARQIMHAHFFEQIRDIVSANQLAPQYITLELTESLLIDDTNHMKDQFKRISDYGFGLCLDDFGTGYSSLSTLHNFNFNCLKLDRSFVVRSTEQGRAAAVLPAIVGIARLMGITCVAEGVELEAQAEVLRAMGCEYVQGYLFARPMPFAQLKQWLGESLERYVTAKG